MSEPKNYTVGWICAIEPEYVAAQEFLDDEHEGPEYVSQNDKNDYKLGRVGKHNVVIAVLPNGEYGLTAAANVANDMLHSFPNVRIGLMVGIGGGAPSPDHDIRLGDIVVSSPHNGQGSVFQYDFGKEIQGQDYKYTRLLNEPPAVLSAAMAGLKAKYRRRGHQLEETIKGILEKNPRLREEYKRPDLHSDRLYQASHTHPRNKNKVNCSEACGNDPSTFVYRPDRTEDKDIPEIHYGVIASGNTLMKNAEERDRLAREKDVLCFEMEAAGLRKDFPCLVIRGICDYSDSHKNKAWQGYAAMAAAAYAKELLCQIAPSRVEAERKITDILSSVENGVQDTKNAVKDLGFEQKREKIERWLSPPDPSTNYNRALQQRQEGTGLWFFQTDAFAKWKEKQNSFLWLHGIPGCGKTILSSTIIKDLTVPRQSLLYFYFDFNDTGKQTLESMVRSLINQLYPKCGDTSKELDSLFSTCEDGRRQPPCELLCKAFWHMIEQAKEVWIVLDALDECRTRKGLPTDGLLSWIRYLLSSEQRNVHLLMTSRPEPDIKSTVSEFAHNDDIVPIQSDLITNDIHAYVHMRVREHEGLKRWRSQPEIQDEIEIRLMGQANGMFRWAACQLDALENCLEYPTLQNALASLPKTLDETYSRILHGIPPEYKQNAIRILQFLTYSERPLGIKEAVDAIAVNTEVDQYFNPRHRMPDPQEITCFCSSLVVLEDMKLQLAHFSVKTYLTSERLDKDIAHNFQEVAAKASIATMCLAYLLHLDQDIPINKIREAFPLAQYSARYWMSHAVVAEGKDGKLQGFIEKLFCHHRNSYWNCYSLYQPDLPDLPWDNEPAERRRSLAPALYYASFGGLVKAVQYILSEGADVNAQGGRYGTALQAASKGGHEKIVELLLKEGADINAQGGRYGTALQAASKGGHGKVIELLLSNGADVNVPGRLGTALQAASSEGHERLVKLLLSNGADVNALPGRYGTALQAASRGGHEQVVELLLNNRADINAPGGDYLAAKKAAEKAALRGGFWKWVDLLLSEVEDADIPEEYGTALQAASGGGHGKVVELLLSNGADINAPGKYTALQAASLEGHERVVELLLSNGAAVNAPGGEVGTALQAASRGGYERVVELLLSNGAAVNAPGGEFGTALQAASREGHKRVVRLLLSNGADVNALPGRYSTALQAASRGGHEKVVELLLSNGADVNAPIGEFGTALQVASRGGYEKWSEWRLSNEADVNKPEEYGTALQAASRGGHGKVVELLLSNGADVNAPGGEFGTALQAASREGHERVVGLLLSKGADVNAPSGEYGTALQAASGEGHERVVKLLLSNGAAVNVLGELGTALLMASGEGHERVVELLLSNGADINALGGEYSSTSLQAASGEGHERVVELLLSNGAAVNALGRYGTALQVASREGHEKIVELLLKEGADVNAQGREYGSALQAASFGGHEKIIELLLKEGARW